MSHSYAPESATSEKVPPAAAGPQAAGPQRAASADSPGVAPNVAGGLAYLLGILTGALFLVLDRGRAFVRFHALQSIALSVAWIAACIALTVVGFVLDSIPVIGWLTGLLLWTVLGLGGLILWLIAMIRAFQGREWEIPLLGPQARRLATSPPAAPAPPRA